MHQLADNVPVNQSNSIAHHLSESNRNMIPVAPFHDSRPEVIAQRRLQDMANAYTFSRQAQSMPASGDVLQMQMVIAFGDIDATIIDSKKNLIKANNATEASFDDKLPLAAIGSNETLHLDAHGAAPKNEHDIHTAALYFGNLTPEKLAAKLIEKGLPKYYQGTIYLNGCHSGTGDNVKDSYAYKFQEALKSHARVSVEANKGISQVNEKGETLVSPDTIKGKKQYDIFKKLESEIRLRHGNPVMVEMGKFIQKGVTNLDTKEQTRMLQIKDEFLQLKNEITSLMEKIRVQHKLTFLPDKEHKLKLERPSSDELDLKTILEQMTPMKVVVGELAVLIKAKAQGEEQEELLSKLDKIANYSTPEILTIEDVIVNK